MHFRAVLLFLALTGCDGATPAPDEDAQVQARSNPATPVSSDSLRLTIAATVARSPQTFVHFDVRLSNTTDRPVDAYLTGRTMIFDIVVTDESGREVWRRLHGEALQTILRVERIPARGSLELRHDWDGRTNAGQPVPPGEYDAIVVIPTDGPPLRSEAIRLRIPS